jgi:M6 family metalloprotease-like protein
MAAGLLAFTSNAIAAPVRTVPLTLKQPNGTSIQAQYKGDEYLNWLETTSGDTFVLNKNSGAYEYAVISQVSGKSTLVPSGVAVGSGAVPAMVNTGVTNRSAMYTLWQDSRKAFELINPKPKTTTSTTTTSKTLSTTAATTFATTSATALPDVPLLVILVDYTDDKFQSPDSTWQQKIFGTTGGSVNDYYKEVSNGRFKFAPATETYGNANDGIVHVKLNYANPLPVYNGPSTWSATHKVLAEALALAHQYINFAPFDKNGDGQLDTKELSVVFFLAGKELAYAQYPDGTFGVYGQTGDFEATNQTTFDGVRIPKYVTTGERHGDHDAAIGVVTHELGHLTFGLPDLYDPWSNFTTWDLMAGAWGQKAGDAWGGITPPHLSAFCKVNAGFITPAEVELMYAPTDKSLYPPLNANYGAVKILTNNANEYFYVEHRRLEGFDRGMTMEPSLYGKSGLLITRGATGSKDNLPISIVQLVRANGSTDNRAGFSLTDMFYPNGGNTQFTPNSTPNSLINGVNVGAVVQNIGATTDTMTMTIKRDDPNGYNCKAYTATNSAHVTANRAYTATTGTFITTTTWYAIGSKQSLGTSGSTSTTLKEGPAGYFIKGTCPVNQKPVVQSVTASTTTNVTDVSIAVSDTERDLVRVEYQLDNGTWIKATGTGNPTSGNFTYTTRFIGLANGSHPLNVRATDAAGNVSTVYSQSIQIGAAACYTATNSAHVTAGRANVKYTTLYYANGSNDYLGTSTTTTSLQMQSANYWKKVTSCP